jgi:hypothetical protein
MDNELAILKKALAIASKKARSLNVVMGQDQLIVKGQDLVKISSDGNETILRKAKFGTVEISKRHFILKSN